MIYFTCNELTILFVSNSIFYSYANVISGCCTDSGMPFCER